MCADMSASWNWQTCRRTPHDASRNYEPPGKSVRVMDCAGRAPAATALSPARASRELLSTVARTKAAWRFASRRSP